MRTANDELVHISVDLSETSDAQTVNSVGIISEGGCDFGDLQVAADLGTELSLVLTSPMIGLTNPSVSVRIHVAEDYPPG